MNNTLLGIIAAFLYAAATLLLTMRFRRVKSNETASISSQLVLIGLALLFHAALLMRLLFHTDGINLGFFNSLTLFAWLCLIVGLTVSIKQSIQHIALALMPFNIITIILALALTPADHIIHAPSTLLQIHIMLSIFSYCLLSIGALLAILLSLRDYQLHNHRPGQIAQTLPPLQTLENIMFKLIAAGFILLTMALASGFIFTDDWFNHKIVFSCIAWLVFLILLCGRYLAGWRGRTAIRWSIGGIVLLMLAFFGTKLVLEIILQR
jgi:ABC-type uncharacterized transport system permease subunit